VAAGNPQSRAYAESAQQFGHDSPFALRAPHPQEAHPMRRIARRTYHRGADGIPLAATVLLAALLMLALAGCAGHHREDNATATGVQLSHGNYRLITPGAQGSSSGFRLLEFIPVMVPSIADAKSDLYRSIGAADLKGRAVALTNLSEDSYTIHFLLFAIPRVRVSADVIEFTDVAQGSSAQLRTFDPNAPVPCRELGNQLVCDTPVR
jgi:hypothetical protein